MRTPSRECRPAHMHRDPLCCQVSTPVKLRRSSANTTLHECHAYSRRRCTFSAPHTWKCKSQGRKSDFDSENVIAPGGKCVPNNQDKQNYARFRKQFRHLVGLGVLKWPKLTLTEQEAIFMVGYWVAKVCADKFGIFSCRQNSTRASRGRQLGGSAIGQSGSSELGLSAQTLG